MFDFVRVNTLTRSAWRPKYEMLSLKTGLMTTVKWLTATWYEAVCSWCYSCDEDSQSVYLQWTITWWISHVSHHTNTSLEWNWSLFKLGMRRSTYITMYQSDRKQNVGSVFNFCIYFFKMSLRSFAIDPFYLQRLAIPAWSFGHGYLITHTQIYVM